MAGITDATNRTTMPTFSETRRSSTVRVQLSFPSGGEHGDRASLRIDDVVSGQTLAEIQLSAAQFLEFMSCTAVRVDVSVPSPVGTTRLFRQRVISTQVVPHEIVGNSAFGQQARAQRWAEKRCIEEGWEHYEVAKSRVHWQVVFSRWVEPGHALHGGVNHA
jgi:hypothetical protein